jgi:hypothetical protein
VWFGGSSKKIKINLGNIGVLFLLLPGSDPQINSIVITCELIKNVFLAHLKSRES